MVNVLLQVFSGEELAEVSAFLQVPEVWPDPTAPQTLGARFVQACAVEMHMVMSQKTADQEQRRFALPELCYTTAVIFESIVYPQC